MEVLGAGSSLEERDSEEGINMKNHHHHRHHRQGFWPSLVALALAACGAPNPDAQSQSLSGPDNPCITIDLTSQDLECSDDSGKAVLEYSVHTTHGTATATVIARVDGGADVTIDTIVATEWTTSSGISSAKGDAKLDLATGTHSIVLCVVQGSNHDCTDAFTVDVECEAKPPMMEHQPCNQGVGNGPEGCDPGNSNNNHGSNDENGGTPGDPGRAHNKT
jgi:hypothetical protein